MKKKNETTTKKSFQLKVWIRWNRFMEVVESPSFVVFNSSLHKHLSGMT